MPIYAKVNNLVFSQGPPKCIFLPILASNKYLGKMCLLEHFVANIRRGGETEVHFND